MENARTVTKGEFAALTGRSAGRVSQWIAAGQIGPEALAGEGRTARIVVDVALRHLNERLDPAQRVGLNSILAGGAIERAIASAAQPEQPAVAPPAPDANRPEGAAPLRHADRAPAATSGAGLILNADGMAEAIAREKLEQNRMQTARMRRDERAADGTYMLATDARAAIAKAASAVIAAFEGGLMDAANAVSAKFTDVPARDVQHVLAGWLRQAREQASHAFADQAALAEELVADEDIESGTD